VIQDKPYAPYQSLNQRSTQNMEGNRKRIFFLVLGRNTMSKEVMENFGLDYFNIMLKPMMKQADVGQEE